MNSSTITDLKDVIEVIDDLRTIKNRSREYSKYYNPTKGRAKYEKNKEKILQYSKEYYKKNKEYFKAYREKNKERKRIYDLKYNAKRRIARIMAKT